MFHANDVKEQRRKVFVLIKIGSCHTNRGQGKI